MNQPDRTPKPCHHTNTSHVHGTRACYVHDKCRCYPCNYANTQYVAGLTKDLLYGRDRLVDAGPARTHIRTLQSAGLGWKTIAARAGLAPSVINNILWGRPLPDDTRRPPTRRITPDTEARILAVPVPTLTELAGGTPVDPTGTMRRLQALHTLGWTILAIARQANMDRQALDRAMHGQGVTAATAKTVARIYNQLWNTPAPTGTRGEKSSATRARNLATTNGWAPPAAWDDDTIDQADATPADQYRKSSTNDRLDDLADLIRHGVHPDTAAQRVGYSLNSIYTTAIRHGRTDVLEALRKTA